MARKYSLKDNPIFQGLQVPEPQPEPIQTPEIPEVPAEAPAAEVPAQSEGQNLTLKNRPSNSDTLNPLPDESPRTEAEPLNLNGADPSDIRDNIDRYLFFGFYNEVADVLLPTLEPSSQVLYSRLFRLSYGFNRNYCTVSQPSLMKNTGLSRNTVRTSLQSLTKNGWLRIIESGNRISTTYRVVLPREQGGFDGSRISISDPQNLTLKNRPSNSDTPEGQNPEVQNLTPKTEYSDNQLNLENLPNRGSNFEGQKLTPLLSLTNRSLTLSKRESDSSILDPEKLNTLAEELVGKFYTQLGQRASKPKREQSAKECIALLSDGFTPEEVEYGIDWLIKHHPETGAFNRLSHFIDQALKARAVELQAADEKERGRVEAEQLTELAAQQATERVQIEAALNELSSAAHKKLVKKAIHLVREEHGEVKHGRDILIQIKVEELVREQYLEK